MKKNAYKIIKKLQDNGHKAYIVGGAIRNQMLGIKVKDYDISTSALPDQIKKIFPKNINIGGEKFGIIVVVENGIEFEIATFRKDGKTSDGRRPSNIKFSNEIDDVMRRDFTINGMLYDPIKNIIIDHVNGQNDIENRIIKTIGNPDDRFNEDYLRIIRAIRFASTLNFRIEKNTFNSIKKIASKINDISRERFSSEFVKILTGNNPFIGIKLLLKSNIFKNIFSFSEKQVNNILKRFKKIKNIDIVNAMAIFLLDINNIENILKNDFKFDNNMTKKIIDIINNHKIIKNGNKNSMAKIKITIRKNIIRNNIEIFEIVDNKFVKFIEKNIRIQKDLFPIEIINGKDLIKLGFKPGKIFKEVIDCIKEMQLNEIISTKKDAIKFIKNNF